MGEATDTLAAHGLPSIRWGCVTCADEVVWHETRCWPTTTQGLAVVNESWGHQHADDVPWQIIHVVSGQPLPGWYGSPEAAMAAAAELRPVEWDWTRCEIPPIDVQRETVRVLDRFGRAPGGGPAPAPTVINSIPGAAP